MCKHEFEWAHNNFKTLKVLQKVKITWQETRIIVFSSWLIPSYRVTPSVIRSDSTVINQHCDKCTWTSVWHSSERRGWEVGKTSAVRKSDFTASLGSIFCFVGPTGPRETESATRAAPPTSKRLFRKTRIWHWPFEFNWLQNIRSSEAGLKSQKFCMTHLVEMSRLTGS